jgi:hypothetical protein
MSLVGEKRVDAQEFAMLYQPQGRGLLLSLSQSDDIVSIWQQIYDQRF